ncbi:class I SAM-dependent methyltransferase, partial [Campylobacter jejuni]
MEFFSPGLACNHIDKVGGDIDLCIIDTMHSYPGEALDFLFVLPYLSKNAVVIMHDLTFHILCDVSYRNVCSVLFSSFFGRKHYLRENYIHYGPNFQNIGYCVLDDNQMEEEKLYVYFKLLNLPWNYMLKKQDICDCIEFFKLNYTEDFLVLFLKILEIQQKWFETDKINFYDKWRPKKSLSVNRNMINSSGKDRIHNRLSYKIGQALIENSKSIWG